MTFLTYMMLGCLLMLLNLRDGKFNKKAKEMFPEFEKKLLSEGIAITWDTYYKVTLVVVMIMYTIAWPYTVVKMVVKSFDKEKK